MPYIDYQFSFFFRIWTGAIWFCASVCISTDCLLLVFSVRGIFLRRSKYCLEFSITWGRLKISSWQFHSCLVFEAYLINSLRFSNFHFISQAIFRKKRKPKIFGLKNAMERGIRKCFYFVIRQIACKSRGKIILKPF